MRNVPLAVLFSVPAIVIWLPVVAAAVRTGKFWRLLVPVVAVARVVGS